MATIGYAELPVPAGADAPAGPGALAALATAIDPHLVHHVANLAERNTRFAGAPVHTVVTAADGTVWKKTATSNTWVTWWEPEPAWRPLPLLSAFQAGQVSPEIKRVGGRVRLRGRIVRTDGTQIIGTNGVQVATVPTDCRPPSQIATSTAFFSTAGDPLIGAGRMESHSNDQAIPGALIFWSQDGAQDGGTVGTGWIDISGSYSID